MSDLASKGALSGIKVLDLSRILAGPWAGQMLADLGADVIKVERPQSGDDTRTWGPPFFETDEEGSIEHVAAYFHSANRGKRSVAIDFTQQEGQQLVQELAKNSDVVIENYKYGGLKNYNLDYETLSKINPRLVYCSITGFGQTGPYKERAGYDFMIQAMGGLMSVTGEPDGAPMKVGVAVTDILTGLYASNAIQAALLYRHRSGLGQYIDLALLDVQVAAMANQAMNYLATGDSPGRLGNAHPNIVPYQAFSTSDDYIILAVGNDGQFKRFCQVGNCQHLSQDERYATNQKRVANRLSLIPLIEAVLKTQSRAWWLAELENVSVPCGPINNLEQVFDDDQVKARGLQLSLHHPDLGEIPSVANPIQFSDSKISYQRAGPSLGADTDDILATELNYTEALVRELKAKGVIG